MAKSAEQLKRLSIKEFTEAARIYESGHAGIYEICKDDYPQMLEELQQELFQDVLETWAAEPEQSWSYSTGSIPTST